MAQGSRVATVPNLISVARLACIPLFLWLLEEEPLAAAGLLAVLGASDWVDGWIARRFNQVSDVGKVLDPLADRLLLITAALALVVDGAVPLLVGVLVLAREVVVSAAVVALAVAGARRIDVQWAGKAGTLALMFAFPLFLLGDAVGGLVSTLALVAAWIFTVLGLGLSYYAAVTYLPLARAALRDGRVARSGGTPTARAGSVSR